MHHERGIPRGDLSYEDLIGRRDADRARREKYRDTIHVRHQAYKKANKVKMKAHRLVAKAVKDGDLVRPEHCTCCGRAGIIEGHHDDYTMPLVVNWLCTCCHGKRHSELKALANPAD